MMNNFLDSEMLAHLQAVLAHWDIPPVTAKHLSFLTLRRCCPFATLRASAHAAQHDTGFSLSIIEEQCHVELSETSLRDR
jgi:hypothetical protein